MDPLLICGTLLALAALDDSGNKKKPKKKRRRRKYKDWYHCDNTYSDGLLWQETHHVDLGL